MTFSEITDAVKKEKCAGFRYQQSGHGQFRDRLTVYCDGKIRFERFCYGEAAGLVFAMTAKGADGAGVILWDYDACRNSRKTDAPRALTGGDAAALLLDGKASPWARTEALKSDAPHGYGRLRMLLGR
ncbi:MAG: hypothetical protein RSA17_00485 [Ruthenibacterium sp.]